MNHPLVYTEKLLRVIRIRQQGVVDTLTSGPVPDYAAFTKLRGKFEELQQLELELRNLLKQEVEMDD